MQVTGVMPSRIASEHQPRPLISDCVSKRTLHDDGRQRTLSGKRILLVEDDYLLAFELLDEFEGRGAEVIGPVGELDIALELARSEPLIDAAVVDINLHGELAFHLVDELIRRDIPVVFTTGYDQAVVPYRLRHIPRYRKPVSAREVALGIADRIAEQRSTED